MIRISACALSLLACEQSLAETAPFFVRQPTYKAGETFDGTFTNASGSILQLRQFAARGPGKNVYVLSKMVDAGGNVLARSLFDPIDMRKSLSAINGGIARAIGSTCSLSSLYPITLGKRYGCSWQMKKGDHEYKISTYMVFDGDLKDDSGKRIGICAHRTDSEDGTVAKSDICYTLDMRWVISSITLSVDRPEKI